MSEDLIFWNLYIKLRNIRHILGQNYQISSDSIQISGLYSNARIRRQTIFTVVRGFPSYFIAKL